MKCPTAILFDFGGTILGDRRYDPEGGYARLLDYAIPPDTLTLKEVREEAVRLDSDLEKHYGLIEFPVQSFLQNFHKHVLLSIHDTSLSKKRVFSIR